MVIMRKLALFLASTFVLNLCAQNPADGKGKCDPIIMFGKCVGGSTITTDDLSEIESLSIVDPCNTKGYSYKILSYDISMKIKGQPVSYRKFNALFPKEICATFSDTKTESKIFIDQMKVLRSDGFKKTLQPTALKIKPGPGIRKCRETVWSVEGKLLRGPNKDIPITHQLVALVSNSGDTLKTTESDDYGDFAFKQVNGEKASIYVPNSPAIKDEPRIYLATQQGTILNMFVKGPAGFAYRILPSDLEKLKPQEEEDAELKLNDFAASAAKTLTVVENIHYASNEYKVTPEIEKKLEPFVATLTKNKHYKIEIYSHTDSQGDDASNMKLSEDRANAIQQYLSEKGIDQSRILAKGMGEKQILNRCANGVKCSDKEHELNRRTEFKFIK